MPVYRYYLKDLKSFARETRTTFRTRPRGRNFEILKERGAVGNFRLISERPLAIAYGSTIYTLTKNYLEIEISDEEIAGVDTTKAPLEVYIGFRLATFSGTFNLVDDIKKTFGRLKRHIWSNGEPRPFPRVIRDTGTLTLFPSYEIAYPFLKRILIYIYFRPRIAIRTAVERLKRILGVSKKEVREHMAKAKAETYLKEIIYESYPRKYWPLLATRVVSEKEGEYTFSALRRELTKFGLSYSQAFDTIWKAVGEGLIEERKTPAYYRYFTTTKGKTELKKLPRPKIKRGLIVTSKGREFIFR